MRRWAMVLPAAMALLGQGAISQMLPRAQRAALQSLLGQTLYSCAPRADLSGRVSPYYLDEAMTEPADDRVRSGDVMTVVSASLGALVRDSNGVAQFSNLTLHLQDNSSAGVNVWLRAAVPISAVSGRGILAAIWQLPNIRRYWVGPVEIGMPVSDVYCSLGLPEHEFDDALGDDQLMYEDGALFVYVDDGGRVVDVQTLR